MEEKGMFVSWLYELYYMSSLFIPPVSLSMLTHEMAIF